MSAAMPADDEDGEGEKEICKICGRPFRNGRKWRNHRRTCIGEEQFEDVDFGNVEFGLDNSMDAEEFTTEPTTQHRIQPEIQEDGQHEELNIPQDDLDDWAFICETMGVSSTTAATAFTASTASSLDSSASSHGTSAVPPLGEATTSAHAATAHIHFNDFDDHMIHNLLSRIPKETLRNILNFLSKARPLTGDKKKFEKENEAPDSLTVNEGIFESEEGRSLARNHFQRICRALPNLTTSKQVRAGPIAHNQIIGPPLEITITNSVTWRPLKKILQAWMSDTNFISAGYIASSPSQSPAQGKIGNYSQSEHMRDMEKFVLQKFPNKPMRLLALALWTDSAIVLRMRSTRNSAHPMMLGLLNGSNQMARVPGRGTRYFGFLNLSEKASSTKKKHSDESCLLRQQIFSKSVFATLEDLHLIQETGLEVKINGNTELFYPYLAMFICDLPEARTAMATLHCPLCVDGGEAPNGEQRLFPDPSNITKNSKKIDKIEKKQEELLVMNEGDNKAIKKWNLEEHRKFYHGEKGNNFKPIKTFVDRLMEQDRHMEQPCYMVDMLHTLNLGEAKKILTAVFEVSNKNPKSLLDILDKIPEFPLSLRKLDGALNSVATDYPIALILLIVVLEECECMEQEELHLSQIILDDMVTLIKILFRDEISVEDLETVKHSSNSLRAELPKLYSKTKKLSLTEISHLFFAHLVDDRVWKRFGVPKGFSSSRFELSLGLLKSSVQNASNNSPGWKQIMLNRFSIGDIIIPIGNQILKPTAFYSPWTLPKYEKVMRISSCSKKFELGFVDTNRGNLYIRSHSLLLSVFFKPGKRFGAVTFGNDKVGVVKGIRATRLNHMPLVPKAIYPLSNVSGVVFVEELVPEATSANSKHWRIMKLSKNEVPIALDAITGGCHVFQGNKLWVLDSELSSVVKNNSASRLEFPDKR